MLNKNLKEECYVNVFAADDKKKQIKNYNFFYNLKTHSFEKILDECTFYNTNGFGSFVSLNPLTTSSRKKENVKKINFVFIDLDNANKKDFEGVITFIESKGIKYCYTAETGSGYHIILEVDLDKSKEQEVKNFLKYLHTHISNTVDISTGDLTRLIRVPESEHNKKEPKMLKTLFFEKTPKADIINNNELIPTLKIEESKEELNTRYQQEIKREDVFFSEIISNSNKWNQYKKILDDATQRNNIFLKNFGIFLNDHPTFKREAIFFIEKWEKQRIPALEGWINKAKLNNMKINYPELLKWTKDNNIESWTQLLQLQLKETFLDEYEVYFLEEEKAESNSLLFFPKKNYYVQKSIQEVILNIFYDCKEKGIDLVKELKLKVLFEKWEEFSFKKQMMLIQDQIRRILENENRIKLIYNINYSPVDEKFIYLDNKKFFNIYKKTNLMSLPEKNIDEYDFRHIKDLIMNLCENKKEYYDWFISWLAYQIQNPTSKLPTAVIFQGEQGTGKGVLKTHILDPIFGQNCQEINQTHLESSFNEYLLGKQIIVANEVMHNENRQTLPNILKNLVTDEYITIQRKFRKDLVIRNYTHWIFCTNSDNPIKIEEGDRRYSVFKSKKLKVGGSNAMKFVNSLIDNKDHELPHFLTYLKNIEVDYYSIASPLLTDAKEDIIELNKDSVERFVEFLKTHDNYVKAYLDLMVTDTDLGLIPSGNGLDYIKCDNFYLFYINWAKKFGEKAVFNKQNFSRRMTSKKINKQVKRESGKLIRAYPLMMLDNFIGGVEE